MTAPSPEQAFAALRRGGLITNDPDLVKLFDLSKPDYVERARAEKPALFHFDARTAPAAEVEARFAEIEAAAIRGQFDAASERALVKLRAERGSPARTRSQDFDARTATAEEVEARLSQMIRGY